MSEEELALVERFEHYLYDEFPRAYKSWYPEYKTFEELWKMRKEPFQRTCPSPDWSQRCKDRGLAEFWPYTREAIDLKLSIYGY